MQSTAAQSAQSASVLTAVHALLSAQCSQSMLSVTLNSEA